MVLVVLEDGEEKAPKLEENGVVCICMLESTLVPCVLEVGGH